MGDWEKRFLSLKIESPPTEYLKQGLNGTLLSIISM